MRITLNDILHLNSTASIIISRRSQGDVKAVLDRETRDGQATEIGIGKTVADALTDLEDALNET